MMLFCLYILLGTFSATYSYRERLSDPGLRYAYTLVVDTKDGGTGCFSTGYVDGEPFISYSDGTTHRLAKWLPDMNLHEEIEGFSTKCKELRNEVQHMINGTKILGIKTLQLDMGCKSTFSRRYAYDGEDVKTYSLNGTSNQICRSKLQLYRALIAASARFPQLDVERRSTRRPEIVRLRCIARDFYPADLDLQWWREFDGRFSMIAESSVRDSLPSGDGVYQKHLDLHVDSGDEHIYSCHVRGIATKRQIEIIKWKGYDRKKIDSALLIALLFPASVISTVFIAVLLIRRRKKTLSRTRGSNRAKRQVPTRRPSYRVNRHTEPPYFATTIWAKDDTVNIESNIRV